MGLDIARAALAAGHALVATARSADAVERALGKDERPLTVALAVTDPDAAQAAIVAAGHGPPLRLMGEPHRQDGQHRPNRTEPRP